MHTSQITKKALLRLLLPTILTLFIQTDTPCFVQAFASTTRQSSHRLRIRQTTASFTTNTANVMRNRKTRIQRCGQPKHLRVHNMNTKCCSNDELSHNKLSSGKSDQARLSPPSSRRTPSFQSWVAAFTASFMLCLGFNFQPLEASVAFAAQVEPDTTTTMTATTITSTTTETATSPAPPYGKRYWSIMDNEKDADTSIVSPAALAEEREWANKALLDYAVGTITSHYYDNSGGAFFIPNDFAKDWHIFYRHLKEDEMTMKKTNPLNSREGAVATLKHMVKSLNDPYSQYLTREELLQELDSKQQFGLLGIGAMVEAPPTPSLLQKESARYKTKPIASAMMTSNTAGGASLNSYIGGLNTLSTGKNSPAITTTSAAATTMLSVSRAIQLPVVTAIVPDSPAERAGLVVGDRIVAVRSTKEDFLSVTMTKHMMGPRSRHVSEGLAQLLEERYIARPDVKYFGQVELVVAKPFYVVPMSDSTMDNNDMLTFVGSNSISTNRATSRETVVGYRPTRVKLSVPTEPWSPSTYVPGGQIGDDIMAATRHKIAGGDHLVHYELLSSESGSSILDRLSFNKMSLRTMANQEVDPANNYNGLPRFVNMKTEQEPDNKVGYIRLTRFSKATTSAYFQAIQTLEEAGAQSYIIDLRNNYGGVIQEAMLTASTLLQDCHSILCFTLNTRGGFVPHDVQEFVLANTDRYPGYLLSGDARSFQSVTLKQAKHCLHETLGQDGEWVPPSSYASLHEQTLKRGLKKTYQTEASHQHQTSPIANPKKIVVLVNEGTASAAELFASALHDNGRLVALVGTKTYGKGLIQHTFPMPDGGGLRLTVAEYLTPALHHVTTVGNARFDPITGEFVGGGIRPDLYCESHHGIPGSDVGADLCVGMALDVLEDAAD